MVNTFTKSGRLHKSALKGIQKATLHYQLGEMTQQEFIDAGMPTLTLTRKFGWQIHLNTPDKYKDDWDNKGSYPYGMIVNRARSDFNILLHIYHEAVKVPLDHRTVNIETPDRGIGTGTITLLVSHPTKGEHHLIQDVKNAWDKQEEEEWESDDVLEEKLAALGYTIHDTNGNIIHIDLT